MKAPFGPFEVLHFTGILLSTGNSCVQLHGRVRQSAVSSSMRLQGANDLRREIQKASCAPVSTLSLRVRTSTYLHAVTAPTHLSYLLGGLGEWVEPLTPSKESGTVLALTWKSWPLLPRAQVSNSFIKLWFPAVPCILVVPHFPVSDIFYLPSSLSGLEQELIAILLLGGQQCL